MISARMLAQMLRYSSRWPEGNALSLNSYPSAVWGMVSARTPWNVASSSTSFTFLNKSGPITP